MLSMKKLVVKVGMALVCAVAAGAAGAAPAPLTTLRAVAALTNSQASLQPHVAFDATVIYYFGPGQILDVQDGDVGIYVKPAKDVKLVPGDRVLVQGTLEPSFLPYVDNGIVTVLGHGALPKPVDATFADLVSTRANCRLVRIRGIVRTADVVESRNAPRGRIQLLMDGGYADLVLQTTNAAALRKLLDAEVAVVGAAGREFDSKIQQTGVKIKVLSLGSIKVLKPAPANPWTLPYTPLGRIITAYRVRDLSQRVHVRGAITYYLPGTAAVLENGASSLWVATDSDAPLKIGDLADAIGFPSTENHHLSLVHAEIRDSGVKAPIQPHLDTWEQIGFWAGSTPGGHEYDLVSTEGRVVTEVREAAQDEYVLTSGKSLFTAIYHHPPRSMPLPPMYHVPLGSIIRVTGICTILDSNPVNGEASFNILLRSFHDIEVVDRPSLLNVRNLAILVAFLVLAVLLVGSRGWLLERKVRRETAAMAYIERRRSRILEQINNARPLVEIVEQITEVVSFKLRGAPCWCQLADGSSIGNKPSKVTSQQIVQQEIPGRSGVALGAICAALDSLVTPGQEEQTALLLGAGLAKLAIETSQLYADLVHRSEFDLLTDVPNRFSFERSLDGLIQSARQSGGLFGLVYIDLNGFKLVNDLYGHQVGDLYLQEVARRMKSQLRPADILARLGGDEFAALIPSVHTANGVHEIAERLERCFVEPFAAEGYTVHGSASVGVAVYPKDGTTGDFLLSAADAAMYVSKHSGRENGCSPEGREAAASASRQRT